MPDRERQRRIEELFHLGAGLPRSEHDAFLDRHCADDAALRDEVRALLDQDELGTRDLLAKGVFDRTEATEQRIALLSAGGAVADVA